MGKNVKIGISVDTNSAFSSVERLNTGLKGFNQTTQQTKKTNKDIEKSFLGLSKSMLETNAHLVLAAQGYKAMMSSVSDFATSFIRLNAEFENTKKNIASLIAVNSSNISTTGKVLNINEKYQLSLQQSSKTLKQFTTLSQKSGYMVADLAEIFQSFYSGASKNMNFDESVRSFENLMQTLKISGLGVEQLKATMDGLGSGAVLASSDLGRFLKQIGLSNEAIKEANTQGALYELIMSKTSENVKVASLALGSYDDNVRLLKSNVDKFKQELSEPLFEIINQNLSAFNAFVMENEESLKEMIKTLQTLTPVLAKIALAYAGLKVYGKVSTILTRGFRNFTSAVIESTNALYQQRVQMLSNTQSISSINKKTLLLAQGFKSLGTLAKEALPLVLVERLLSVEGALDKAFEKTDKLNQAFKNKIELSHSTELEKYKEELEKEVDNIQSIGQLNNSIGNFLSEYSFDFVGKWYKSAAKSLSDFRKDIGYEREQSISDIASTANVLQKLAFVNEKLKNTKTEQMQLQSLQKPNEKAEEVKQKSIQYLKEQNQALKEIAQMGMSEYDKKLAEINEKLKEWQRLGLDKNKIKKAHENLIIDLDLQRANKEFEETKNLMLEYYESIENKQEAWALKEIDLRAKYSELLSEGLIKEDDFNKMVKANKEAYLQINKDSKKAIDETQKHYEKMIANMQKTIESSFFDVINGKIKSLKDLFKDLGKTILQDFLSPYITSLSGFLSRAGAGVLSPLMPNFANANTSKTLAPVVDFAKNQGLSLNTNGKYEGVVNGVQVVMDKTGTIEKGNLAFNNVSNIISGAKSLNGIMSGEWIDKAGLAYDKIMNWASSSGESAMSFSDALHADGFSDFLNSSDISTSIESSSTNIIDSVGKGFNSLFENLQGYIHSIGTFGSNILATSSAHLASWLGLGASFSNGASLAGMGLSGASGAFSMGFGGLSGYLGGLAANAAVGGLLGYGIGSLGDWLFKADTHAGKGGAIGGVLGSLIMPGVGTLVGGLLGSVIGGIFGKTKATGSGLKLGARVNFGDFLNSSDLKGYVDYQKKGWFSKKSWTTYSDLGDKKIKEINRLLENQYATLIKLGANLNQFELAAGKYANNSLFDTALPNALLTSFLNISDKSEINAQIAAIQEKAKENNTTYAQQLSNQFGSFLQMQTSILSQIHKNDPAKVAKLSLDDTLYALKTAMRNITGGFELFKLKENDFKDLAQLSVKELNRAFNESLRQDFSPQNLELWQSLTKAYEQATLQTKNLLDAIISKTSELMQINQNFLSANGISNSIFEVNKLLNSYATLFEGLKNELSTSQKEMLSDIFSANDKLLNLGYEGLNEFLSTGNTELRKELVNIITQFKQITQNQNGLIFSSEYLNELAQVQKLIDAYENKDKSTEESRVKYNENNKLLSTLNQQLSVLNSLGNFSANLIHQSVATSANIASNYDKLLSQAKEDFKNKNLSSSSFSTLQNAASAKANELKNSSSSFAKYQLEMLKMANELKNLDGEADLNSLQNKITDLMQENKELSAKLEQTIKDTSSMSLEELKEYKQTLITQSQAEIQKMVEYLGEDSPIAKYLKESLKVIKDGSSLTQATLANLQYALMQFQNHQASANKDLNQNIINPYHKMRAFADGGIVTRPTNALIGENGYPEAVIPLKDGKGLKIDASGVFQNLAYALEKAIDKGFNTLNQKLDLIALKIENVDKSVKRSNMDLSIISKQTREIIENI